MKNWTEFEGQIFVQNEAVLAKNLLLVSDKLQIQHTGKLPYAQKKTSKITFLSGASNIVKMESEIYEYFSSFLHHVKYLMLF